MDAACPSCSAAAPAGARFCGRCGTGLAVVPCPSCSASNPWDHTFCSACGSRLTPGSAPAPTATTPDAHVEERKLATVLFADVVGFTTMAEHADPEEIAHRVDAAFRRLAAIVEDHGGRVDTYLGDGFMATFGVPVALGDEADRAVAAAIAIAAERPEDLRFSVGVNSGDVLVTSMGGAATVIGDAVNVAARLEKVARAGQVLVGPTTAALCGPQLRLVRRPAILVKGRATPVDVFEAIGLQQPVAAGPDAPPLVGRDDDLAFLVGQWRRALDDRRAAIVLLTGEPGIGKTRLLDELLERARCDGASIVRVTYPAYGGLAGPQVGEEVGRQLGLSGDPSIDDPIMAMADKKGLLHPALAVGAPVGGRDPEALFVDQVFAFRRLAEARAADGPLLVALDDVHRSTDRLLEMLARINAQIGPVPILTILVGRPGDGAWMAGFPSASVLRLSPIGRGPARDLVRSSAPRLDDVAAEAVLDRAGGNPLFLRELAAMVRSAESGAPGLPPTLRALLAARLDAFDPIDKQVVQLVSVLGGGVRSEDVAALAPELPAPLVEGAVQRLVAAGVLAPGGTSGASHLEVSLADSLLAEVAYEALPRQVRGERHRLAASFAPTPALGARHLEKAARHLDDPASRAAAVDALEAAAAVALERLQLPEGVRLLERAVDLGLGAPGLVRLAQLHADAGRHPASLALLDRIDALVAADPASVDPASHAQALHVRGLSTLPTNQRAGLALLDEALVAWQALERLDKVAWVYGNRGMALMGMGRSDESGADLGRAAALFRELGDARGELATVRLLNVVNPDDPRVPEWLATALARAEESGDRAAVVSALSGLAWHGFLRLRMGPASQDAGVEVMARRLAEAASAVGQAGDAIQAWAMASLVATWGGRVVDAAEHACRLSDGDATFAGEHDLIGAARLAAALLIDREAPLPHRSVSTDPISAAARVFVTEALLAAGRVEDAREWWGGTHVSPSLGSLSELLVSFVEGWLCASEGKPEAALPLLGQAEAFARRLTWLPGAAFCCVLQAECHLDLDEGPDARNAIDRALELVGPALSEESPGYAATRLKDLLARTG